MALLDIKSEIIAALGISSGNLLLTQINTAAEELYTAVDLVGSLAEMVCAFDSTQKIVALPHFTGAIRGMRWYSSPLKIKLNDIRPRYSNAGYGKMSLNFREIGYSPISGVVSNQSSLKYTIPKVETSPVLITATGSTSLSSLVTEQVTIEAGQTEVKGTVNFNSYETIKKDRVTLYDVTVLDVEDNVLGVIPNHQLSSNYLIMQVLEDNISGGISQTGVEVLFKQRFRRMVNDSDEFICPGYDSAIVYKFYELYFAKQKGGTEQRDYYKNKCAEVVAQRYRDDARGKEILVDFEENKFYGMASKGMRRYKV